MTKRYTIAFDRELLEKAKRALGQSSVRATVEEALRIVVSHAPLRAVDLDEAEAEDRRANQLQDFQDLNERLDLDVLASDEMGR
jgi:Arc/MetJ family transcription regulator